MLRMFASLLLVSAAFACGAGDDEHMDQHESMTQLTTSFGAELSGLEMMSGQHATAIAGMTMLHDIHSEESAYRTMALGHHGAMSDDVTMMGHCEMSGTTADTSGLTQGLASISSELDQHASAMAAAADSAAAQAEESRFQGAMDAVIQTMHQAHAQLTGDAAEYVCGTHDHM